MNDATTCIAPDCERGIHVYREMLCNAHYQQKLAGKEFSPLRKTKRSPAEGTRCAFEGCKFLASVRELCAGHHYQQSRGQALKPLGRRPVPAGSRNENGEKYCATCDTWKPPARFASSKGKPDGLQGRCRECNAAIYRENAEKVRDKMREARFGITREQFDALFESQGHVCAACGTDDPGTSYWAVDHDHACCPGSDNTCGKCIRGILCRACNHALGNVRDNPETLARLIDYLKEGHVIIPNPTRTRSAR